MKMMSNGALRGFAVAAVLALSACNTVEGVGMDISSGARTVGGWFGGGGY